MILFDITTSYTFRHWKPAGIFRVEREALRAFRDAYGDQVVMGIFDPETGDYYRIPEAIYDDLIVHNKWSVEPYERPPRAPSRMGSWRRVLRFLRRTPARTRAVEGQGHLTHKERRKIIAEELMEMSLEEYSQMRAILGKMSMVRPRLRERILQFDEINHLAHFGMMPTVHDALCSRANLIDPKDVSNYVTAGGFWSDDRYRHVYRMRRDHGWTVHYLIYDLIPVLWRHFTEPTTRNTYPLALHWVLWGVDQIWTISRTTQRDLLGHVRQNGYPDLAPDRVTPVFLGSDLPEDAVSDEERQSLFSRHDLEPGKYVLMVGTQEPRKNHDFAYRLWRELNLRHPGEVMPLVWVGQPGWSIEPLLEQLRNDNGLPAGAIRILPDITDKDLVPLFQECRYTIYPSHYEGWGLPVVESLGYGKPCLTSEAPALIEAGAGASEPICLFDGERWLSRCFELMHDTRAYDDAVGRAARFEGCRWSQFRADTVADFADFLAGDADQAAMPAKAEAGP